MASRNSDGSLHGESVEYQKFRSKLPTLATGIASVSSLISLANQLVSINLITTMEQGAAINGTDHPLARATNMLSSVMTKIKTDSSSSGMDSCYWKFVQALTASDLSHVADQLEPIRRKTSSVGRNTSDSSLSVTSGLGSLSLSESERDGPLAGDTSMMDRRASGNGPVLQASDGFPSSQQAQPKKFSTADTSFDMGERNSAKIHTDEAMLIPGKLPTVNAAHYQSQIQISSSGHTRKQPFYFSSQHPVVPNSAPAGLHGDTFCDICDIREDEAAHYKKVVTNRDDENASIHGVLDRYKTKCKEQMLEIKQLKLEKVELLKDAEQKQKKRDEFIATLSHKLQEMKDVNHQYKELVVKGAKEDKIDKELLELFEAINFS